MIRLGAEPTHLHAAILYGLRGWADALVDGERIAHPAYDTASRFNVVMFLICESERRVAQGLGGLPAQFLDWSEYPACDFFRCPALDTSMEWMAARGWVGSGRRRKTGPRLLPHGADLLENFLSRRRRKPVHPDFLPAIANKDFQERIDETIAETADLDPSLFREHLLNLSIRLFNEPPAFPHLDFDRRYEAADFATDRTKLARPTERL